MNEMINNFTEAAVEAGLKTIDEMPETATTKVGKTGIDGKSVVIGGVGGAVLTATGVAIWNGIKSKPKKITEEIKNDPRVRKATEDKLLKKREALIKQLEEIDGKLDQLNPEDVIIEEETTPEE